MMKDDGGKVEWLILTGRGGGLCVGDNTESNNTRCQIEFWKSRTVILTAITGKQAEKLKSREMKEGWWKMMKDEDK